MLSSLLIVGNKQETNQPIYRVAV